MESTNIDKINEIRETAASLREDLENMGIAANGFFNYIDEKLTDIEHKDEQPKEMMVRITWRMECYISGRDLADIKEKWDNFDIRSNDAEYVETTSVENADTNDDIEPFFDYIERVSEYAEEIEIGEYGDTTEEYDTISQYSDEEVQVFRNTLHDKGLECSYNKTFGQYEITERRY